MWAVFSPPPIAPAPATDEWPVASAASGPGPTLVSPAATESMAVAAVAVAARGAPLQRSRWRPTGHVAPVRSLLVSASPSEAAAGLLSVNRVSRRRTRERGRADGGRQELVYGLAWSQPHPVLVPNPVGEHLMVRVVRQGEDPEGRASKRPHNNSSTASRGRRSAVGRGQWPITNSHR